MKTIMTIAHNANQIAALGRNRKTETTREPKVRVIYETDTTELRVLQGVREKLEVVHPIHKEQLYNHAEEIISAQRKIENAVRIYEDRINKRPPWDIA